MIKQAFKYYYHEFDRFTFFIYRVYPKKVFESELIKLIAVLKEREKNILEWVERPLEEVRGKRRNLCQ